MVMTEYTHKLESHDDIGYNKFFDQFRKEYDDNYDLMTSSQCIEFINHKLTEYNTGCRLSETVNDNGQIDVCLTFDNEKYFNLFLLKWA